MDRDAHRQTHREMDRIRANEIDGLGGFDGPLQAPLLAPLQAPRDGPLVEPQNLFLALPGKLSWTSADRDHVKTNKTGGRHLPPYPGLIGRSEVALILQCDRNRVGRLVKNRILLPALVVKGVSWFDLEVVRTLAKTMVFTKRRKKQRLALLPPGIERCTAKETRQINVWFAEGLAHWEIVNRSGKTNETIRYMFEQYSTPNGGKPKAAKEAPPPKRSYDPDAEYRERSSRREPPAGARRPTEPEDPERPGRVETPRYDAANDPLYAPRKPVTPVAIPAPSQPPAPTRGAAPPAPNGKPKKVVDNAWFNEDFVPAPDDAAPSPEIERPAGAHGETPLPKPTMPTARPVEWFHENFVPGSDEPQTTSETTGPADANGEVPPVPNPTPRIERPVEWFDEDFEPPPSSER